MRIRPAVVYHPGETVREYLTFHGMSFRGLSQRTGLPIYDIAAVCNAKSPITEAFAVELAKVFNRPPSFWINLQRLYEESKR